MRTTLITLIMLFTFTLGQAQFRSVGFIVGAGHTIVDVEKAVDYSPLEEWDNISVVIKATAEYQLKEGLMLGGEFGANRLYYWEYKWSDGFYSGTRYRSEWTTNFGVHITKYFGKVWFAQGGAAIHIFNDGSGTVAGLLAAIGADLSVSEKISIPVAVRMEPVFGNATPIAISVVTGLKYIIR
ncbi:hypothetical protein KA005_34855 [bacterium]|nr:hypothetical protein [bacterium]